MCMAHMHGTTAHVSYHNKHTQAEPRGNLQAGREGVRGRHLHERLYRHLGVRAWGLRFGPWLGGYRNLLYIYIYVLYPYMYVYSL